MATATGSYRSEVFALALALASRLGGVAISIAIIMYKSLGVPNGPQAAYISAKREVIDLLASARLFSLSRLMQ
jgi:hypothetical protein